jgi:hypothetical protein
LDPVQAAEQPYDNNQKNHQEEPFDAADTAGHKAFETVLTLSNQFFQVGRDAAAAAGRATAPRTLSAAVSAAAPRPASTPTLLFPCHDANS